MAVQFTAQDGLLFPFHLGQRQTERRKEQRTDGTNTHAVCASFSIAAVFHLAQHVETNLKAGHDKNHLLQHRRRVAVNKTFFVPKPGATATNMDEGTWWFGRPLASAEQRLQDGPRFAQNSVPSVHTRGEKMNLRKVCSGTNQRVP